MAENQYNSKIVLSSGEVLMDLTQDTVVADKLLKGFTAHGKDGAPITGSCEFDADTGDATAGAAEILTGKTAYVTGSKVTGTMPNNGAKTLSITEKGKPVTIPQGYHDGSGKAQIDAAEEAKLIPANIREGITVLGVLGTMSGSEGMKPQATSSEPKRCIRPRTSHPRSPRRRFCPTRSTTASAPSRWRRSRLPTPTMRREARRSPSAEEVRHGQQQSPAQRRNSPA